MHFLSVLINKIFYMILTDVNLSSASLNVRRSILHEISSVASVFVLIIYYTSIVSSVLAENRPKERKKQ